MQAGVREASGADAEALSALINEAYGVEAFFVRGLRTDCADVLAQQRTGVFLVADQEGEIVGCVYLRCSSEPAYIGLISVDPKQQGKGLGRRLITLAEERCRAEGRTRVAIWVVNLREELFPWYEALGYRRVREEPFSEVSRLLRPCHFVVMEKGLA